MNHNNGYNNNNTHSKMMLVKESSQRKQVTNMGLSNNGLLVATCFAFLMLSLTTTKYTPLVECQEQLTVESRQQKDNDDLTDTIKYLEKLDKYFSQIARPR